jgi:serine/threonine-protein kinase
MSPDAESPRKYLGRYELVELLGKGGMGEVWLAKISGAAGFEKPCIVKTVLPELAGDQAFVDRFHHEAKVLVHLVHSNIAQVYDMGEADGAFFMALEFVSGVDLSGLIGEVRKSGQPLPLRVALYLAQKTAEGLAYAHRKLATDGTPLNVVHRDVSPHNVMVSYEGEVKLIDFGLAKSAAKSKKTQQATVMGKLGYMSPEQVRALPLDGRTDIYSCGVMLWEMITGQPMVNNGTIGEMMAAMAFPKLPSLRGLRPEVDEKLEAAVMKALAPEVANRYARADEFAMALAERLVNSGNPIGAEEVGNYVRTHCPQAFAAQQRLISRLSTVNAPLKLDHAVAVLESTTISPVSGPQGKVPSFLLDTAPARPANPAAEAAYPPKGGTFVAAPREPASPSVPGNGPAAPPQSAPPPVASSAPSAPPRAAPLAATPGAPTAPPRSAPPAVASSAAPTAQASRPSSAPSAAPAPTQAASLSSPSSAAPAQAAPPSSPSSAAPAQAASPSSPSSAAPAQASAPSSTPSAPAWSPPAAAQPQAQPSAPAAPPPAATAAAAWNPPSSPQSSQLTPADMNAARPSRLPLFIVLGLVVVLVVATGGAGAYWYLLRKNPKTAGATPTGPAATGPVAKTPPPAGPSGVAVAANPSANSGPSGASGAVAAADPGAPTAATGDTAAPTGASGIAVAADPGAPAGASGIAVVDPVAPTGPSGTAVVDPVAPAGPSGTAVVDPVAPTGASGAAVADPVAPTGSSGIAAADPTSPSAPTGAIARADPPAPKPKTWVLGPPTLPSDPSPTPKPAAPAAGRGKLSGSALFETTGRNPAVTLVNTDSRTWHRCQVVLPGKYVFQLASLSPGFRRDLSFKAFTVDPAAPDVKGVVQVKCAEGAASYPAPF